MNERNNLLRAFLDPQSYLNIVYLLMSFPLGLIYFIALVVGLSTGLGLLVVLCGIPILMFTFVMAWAAITFERGLANAFLGTNITTDTRTQIDPEASTGERLRAEITNPANWKGLAYLLAKFPFGIVAFVVSITSIALVGGLLSAPFTYQTSNISFGSMYIDTLAEALGSALVGLVLAPFALLVMNALAGAWRDFTIRMLGNGEPHKRKYVEVGKRKRSLGDLLEDYGAVDEEDDYFYEQDAIEEEEGKDGL